MVRSREPLKSTLSFFVASTSWNRPLLVFISFLDVLILPLGQCFCWLGCVWAVFGGDICWVQLACFYTVFSVNILQPSTLLGGLLCIAYGHLGINFGLLGTILRLCLRVDGSHFTLYLSRLGLLQLVA